MTKELPGIFGEKSGLAKRLGKPHKVKYKEHKPTGKALALSNKLLNK